MISAGINSGTPERNEFRVPVMLLILAYPDYVGSAFLILSSALLLSSAQKTVVVPEGKLLGEWTAVRIVNSKIPVNQRAAYEKEALPWNSIKLLPHHKFEAMFMVPMGGTWSVQGLKIVLKADAIKDDGSKKKDGASFTFKPDPIPLVLSQDGKTVTRSFDGEVITFRKRAS